MSEPIANVDMAKAWDGEEGDQWTQFADEFDTHFRSIWARFLETDPIAPADRVLDIGCGSGQSTRDAARLARDGSALGVDLSESMLAEARRRARTEGLTNVEFLRADAQVHAFERAAFDVVISRFGVMFFADRPAAFANIGSALGRGGRLALLVWQANADNEWIMVVRESMAAGRDLPMPSAGVLPLNFVATSVEGAMPCSTQRAIAALIFLVGSCSVGGNPGSRPKLVAPGPPLQC